MRIVHKTIFDNDVVSSFFCQTNLPKTGHVHDASEEETGEEVKIKEELFHDDSDEEKFIEDGPVIDGHKKQKKEKAK